MQYMYDNDDPKSRFEFREEYWEQALALIEADEARRRKKRRWMLWWCFAGLLLVAAGYGFWKTHSNTIEANKEGQPEKSIVAAPNQVQQRAGDISAPAAKELFSENSGNSREKEPGANAQKETDKNTAGKVQGAKGNSRKNNSDPKDGHIAQLPGNPLLLEQPASKPPGASNGLNVEKSPINNSSTKNPTLDPNAAITDVGQKKQLLPGQTLPNSKTGMLAEQQPDKATTSEPTLKALVAGIFALPLPMDSVNSNKPAVVQKPNSVTAPAAKQIKPIRDSRFSLGFAAAAAAYKPAPDNRWLGVSAGIFTGYKLTERWSASIGLGMRFQPGNWLDTAGAVQIESLKYSFGFESLSSQRRTLGLFSLEIPMAAAWHRGQFAAEAGIAPGRLLFAPERYKEVLESSLNAPKTTKNQLARGETGIYHQFYANGFAGVEWKFTRNVRINLRGNYRFGAILKATPEAPSVKGGSNLELGLKWTFGL